MLAELGPDGAAHGFDPDTHTRPTAALPLAIPVTDQVTVASVVPVTFGENVARCPVEIVAVGGATLTATPLVIVTVAEATSGPPAGCGLTAA